jgi:iron(III) transport system substrate-binding protein
LLGLALFIAGSAFCQDAKLIDAAKKEGGKVVVYGSLESETVDAVKEAFTKKTGLQMDYWRAASTKVMDRAVSEHRVGKPLGDVVLTNASPMEIMFKEGVFAKYNSPTAKDFPKEAIDPNLGPRYRNVIIGIVYNRNLIKPADAPKSLEDLANPKYKGKLVMPDPTQHTTTTMWLSSLHKIMGRERGDKFLRDFAGTKPFLVESLLPAVERVTTGELPIAITYVKYVFVFGKKGAPLEYVRLGKFLGEGHHVALTSKAPHPSAGKAFIDFFLDEQSMHILAGMGEFVNRKGVYPPLPDAEKIQFVEMDELDKKGFAEKRNEYKKLFLK